MPTKQSDSTAAHEHQPGATRRALLGAASSAVGAATLAAAATAAACSEPDPHLAWMAEVDTLHARDGINTGRTDEEIDAEVERLAELREWLSTTPAATFAGAVAQIRYVREDMGRFGSHDYHLDALDLALATLTQRRV